MRHILLLILCVPVLLSCGKNDTGIPAGSVPFDGDYERYSALLDEYAKDGLVNYRALKENRGILDSIVASLASVNPVNLDVNAKMALYINAYNIFTIRSVVDAYPVSSIRDIDGVWDIKKWNVAGEVFSLNDIHHNMLREYFPDPRVNLAIVPAAKGCPHLLNEPYCPETIDKQLQKISSEFVTSAEYNKLSKEDGTARLSAVFDWYAPDFARKYFDDGQFSSLSRNENSVLNFIVQQYPEDQRTALYAVDFVISYSEYDWSLNEMK